MKKKSIAVLVAAVAMSAFGTISAKKSAKTVTPAKPAFQTPVSTQDSINYYIGILTAAQVKDMIQHDSIANFDREKYISEFVRVASLTPKDEATIAIRTGQTVGSNIVGLKKGLGVDISLEAVAGNLNAALAADSLPINGQDAEKEVNNILSRINAQRVESLCAKNDSLGERYIQQQLAANPNLKKSEKGIWYEVIKEGDGDKFNEMDQINILYKGTRLDGTVFDQTEGTQTRVFCPKGVISGFGEALQMMSVGAHYKVIIPGSLAYGKRGSVNGMFEPNEWLVYDIEAVSIKKRVPAEDKTVSESTSTTTTTDAKAVKSSKKSSKKSAKSSKKSAKTTADSADKIVVSGDVPEGLFVGADENVVFKDKGTASKSK